MRGDNGKRARAYPRIEGRCETCNRWLVISYRMRIPRHLCKDGAYAGGQIPILTYNPTGLKP
jgi:hypothetical protein